MHLLVFELAQQNRCGEQLRLLASNEGASVDLIRPPEVQRHVRVYEKDVREFLAIHSAYLAVAEL